MCVQDLGALPNPSLLPAGAPSAGPPKISFFFPSHATISFFLHSLEGLLVNFGL